MAKPCVWGTIGGLGAGERRVSGWGRVFEGDFFGAFFVKHFGRFEGKGQQELIKG